MRNRHRKICICVVFAVASAPLLLAQSEGGDVRWRDDLQQKVGNPSRALLAAMVETPAIREIGNESELPDAPSATQPETSTAEPAASPVVKREASRGAAPAAMGGPFGVDGRIADRNYLVLTGAMFSASVFDAEMTMHCLQQKTCKYLPPSLRSRTALYGIGIPADLGISYLTYYMKKKHSRIWFVPAACVTAANLYVGVHALRELK